MIKLNTRNFLFTGCSVLFVAHQYLQKMAGVHLPVVDNYLDPLVFMPIVLHLVALERRIILRSPDYKLPLVHTVAYFILIVIAGEIVFPLLNTKFVADIADIFFYALGGFVYVISQRGKNLLSLTLYLWLW
jgi:hypothetical protein